MILMGCDTFGQPAYTYDAYISTEYDETRCLNSSANAKSSVPDRSERSSRLLVGEMDVALHGELHISHRGLGFPHTVGPSLRKPGLVSLLQLFHNSSSVTDRSAGGRPIA